MARTADVAVIGLGGMGSAAAYHLARRGERVVGFEQFAPLHDRGSSHGRSRIIRQAYFEHPAYVPLLQRAYELWRSLEAESGKTLYVQTGGLMIGRADSPVVQGSLASARTYGLPHALLDADALRRAYPAFRVADDEIALFEETAGALYPEECIRAHLDGATARGADLRFHAPVRAWRRHGDGFAISVGAETIDVGRLVVTAGAWAGQLLANLGLPLRPERNVVFWFDPVRDAAAFAPERFPIFIWHHADRTWYGLPNLRDDGVKVAFHHTGEDVEPDHVVRTVAPAEVEAMRRTLASYLPDVGGRIRGASVCLYTNTPDEHFAIGLHPAERSIALAGGFSGHGFKFCSVVGEVLADLATEGATRHPIDFLAPTRFGEGTSPSS